MNKNELEKLDKKYIANTYSRFDVLIEEGIGSFAYDSNGKEYIDLTSGIGVNSLGYSDEGYVNAVVSQLVKLQHTSNLFYTEPMIILAEKLCKKTGFKKVFFGNSGSEANEGAIKLARKYSSKKYKDKKRAEIITLKNSFHGRTIGAISATGQDSFHKDFDPFLKGFKYIEASDIIGLKKEVTEKTAAIMFEMIQGEGGVIPLKKEFVNEIKKIATKNDLLIIIDEVQAGIGRTGKFMSYEYYDIQPDIVTVAKGLGGGLPIGAVLIGQKVENVFEPSDHGSTFGGNPVVCSGANYILDYLTDEFLQEVSKKGEFLKKKLLEFETIKEVTGKGLMLGISFKENRSGEKIDNKEFAKKSIEAGVLCLTAKDKLRLLPPLNISYENLEKALEIFKKISDKLVAD